MCEKIIFCIAAFFYLAMIITWVFFNFCGEKKTWIRKAVCLAILFVLNIVGIRISFKYSNGSFDTIPYAISVASTVCILIEICALCFNNKIKQFEKNRIKRINNELRRYYRNNKKSINLLEGAMSFLDNYSINDLKHAKFEISGDVKIASLASMSITVMGFLINLMKGEKNEFICFIFIADLVCVCLVAYIILTYRSRLFAEYILSEKIEMLSQKDLQETQEMNVSPSDTD